MEVKSPELKSLEKLSASIWNELIWIEKDLKEPEKLRKTLDRLMDLSMDLFHLTDAFFYKETKNELQGNTR